MLDFFLKDRHILKKAQNTWYQDLLDTGIPTVRKLLESAENMARIQREPHALQLRLKCAQCGCNFKKTSQPSVGGKTAYWQCADKNGCGTKGLRDDRLRKLSADVLGLEVFDEAVFKEQMEYISLLSSLELALRFRNGHTENRKWDFKLSGHKWAERQRARYMESVKDAFPPERRQKISENMKQIRSEKYWNSKRK